MTIIAVEVPDELAGQLRPLRNQLPRLLSFIVQVFPVEPSFVPLESIASHPAKEMLDFLISRPTPNKFLRLKVLLLCRPDLKRYWIKIGKRIETRMKCLSLNGLIKEEEIWVMEKEENASYS